jgi:hypothetical protein
MGNERGEGFPLLTKEGAAGEVVFKIIVSP